MSGWDRGGERERGRETVMISELKRYGSHCGDTDLSPSPSM